MLRTAVALLLLSAPGWAQSSEPIAQLLPIITEGDGFLSTVTIQNNCERMQNLQAAFLNHDGEAVLGGTLSLLPGKSWQHKFDDTDSPQHVLYGVIVQTGSTCAVTVSMEQNHIKGDRIETLPGDVYRLNNRYFAPGIAAVRGSDTMLMNLSMKPGHVSVCTVPAKSVMECPHWENRTIEPLHVLDVESPASFANKESEGIIDAAIHERPGAEKTFRSDSSITFGAAR